MTISARSALLTLENHLGRLLAVGCCLIAHQSILADAYRNRVFKALNPLVGYAAVKVIATKSTASSTLSPPDSSTLKRILKEIRVHETLKHQHILELFGSREDEHGKPELGIPPAVYIVLAFAEGGDLFDQIGAGFRD